LKKKKAELAALVEWTHINCLRQDAAERVQDDILRKLLIQPSSSHDRQVGNPSKSRLSSLLDAVDLDNISRLESPEVTVKDVPGGTVSFLFEKGTSMSKNENEDSLPL
jgi:DNA repair and recombination protein RAD54B